MKAAVAYAMENGAQAVKGYPFAWTGIASAFRKAGFKEKLRPPPHIARPPTAPLLLDLLWPVFLAIGLEAVRIDPGNTVVTPLDFVSYPYTHRLLMAAVWATLAAGIYHALTRTDPADKIGCDGFGSFVVFLIMIYIGDMWSDAAPPNPQALALVALSLWIRVPWAAWFDRPRTPH